MKQALVVCVAAVGAAGGALPIDSIGDTQCSANTMTQSAELPGPLPAANK